MLDDPKDEGPLVTQVSIYALMCCSTLRSQVSLRSLGYRRLKSPFHHQLDHITLHFQIIKSSLRHQMDYGTRLSDCPTQQRTRQPRKWREQVQRGMRPTPKPAKNQRGGLRRCHGKNGGNVFRNNLGVAVYCTVSVRSHRRDLRAKK
jgi:hypothetical protein